MKKALARPIFRSGARKEGREGRREERADRMGCIAARREERKGGREGRIGPRIVRREERTGRVVVEVEGREGGREGGNATARAWV